MNFKEALIAHLHGEKVEVYGVFTAYDGEYSKWEWRDFGKYYANLELRNVHLRSSAEDIKYRIAPRTIFVNGVEVPAPEKEAPENGSEYRAEFEARFKHLDLTQEPDAWGAPRYKHDAISLAWDAWQAARPLKAVPARTTSEDSIKEVMGLVDKLVTAEFISEYSGSEQEDIEAEVLITKCREAIKSKLRELLQ